MRERTARDDPPAALEWKLLSTLLCLFGFVCFVFPDWEARKQGSKEAKGPHHPSTRSPEALDREFTGWLAGSCPPRTRTPPSSEPGKPSNPQCWPPFCSTIVTDTWALNWAVSSLPLVGERTCKCNITHEGSPRDRRRSFAVTIMFPAPESRVATSANSPDLLPDIPDLHIQTRDLSDTSGMIE